MQPGTAQQSAGRERPASGRVAPGHDLLLRALPSVTSAGAAPVVLDCGGGSGTYAVPLAAAGAQVTVVDVSVDALATLERRAAEAGVADLVHPVQGDVEALGGLVGAAAFDLVLAHGVLEAVDDPAGVVVALAAALRPGGLLSVLVGNPVAAVIGRALAGDLEAARRELAGLDRSAARMGPDVVTALCTAAGLVVETRQGVGVFSDLVPGAFLDRPGARESLAALDAEAAARAPFADIAGRVQLLARRPAVAG